MIMDYKKIDKKEYIKISDTNRVRNYHTISTYKQHQKPKDIIDIETIYIGKVGDGKNYLNINVPQIKWKYSNRSQGIGGQLLPALWYRDKSYVPLAWFLKDGRSFNKFKIQDMLHLNAPINAGLVTSILRDQMMNFTKDRISDIARKFNNRDVAQYSKYLYPYYGDNNVPYIRAMSPSGKYVGMTPAPVRMGLSLFALQYQQMQKKHTKKNKQIIESKRDQFFERQIVDHLEMYNYSHNPKDQTKNLIIRNLCSPRTMKLWKQDDDNIVQFDSLSYQAQSYKDFIWNKNDDGDYIDLDGNIYSQQTDRGSVIKFTIQDVHNERLLTTPAFIQSISDDGLEGQWDQIQFISTQYPKFTYKGMSKRSIDFTFMLGCFDINFLQQYIDKLNFLRVVGAPTLYPVQISNDRILQMPRAPIYKLTLGDIVNNIYGYFQKCSLSWDQKYSWNLDRKKLHDMLFKQEDINLQKEIEDIQIPIFTQIDATFVCMYGRGVSNLTPLYIN